MKMRTTEKEGDVEMGGGQDRKPVFDSTWFDEMVAAARVVYLWHDGRQQREIEKRMHELGWTQFDRKILNSWRRKNASAIRDGRPVQYGWLDQVTPAKPRLKREKAESPARDAFPRWLRATFPEWKWGWKYQRYLYERLAKVTSGRCTRLMIFMPPRHGKSEMVTFRYTAWRLLQDPSLNVIIGSYNQRLANKASRRIQRIFEMPSADCGRRNEEAGNNTVCDKLQSDVARKNPHSTLRIPHLRLTRSVSEWETGGGGTVRAVGVGAGIAGFGAAFVVIDDPVRNRADAESEAYRDKVWDWFNDDIYTRLEPKAAIIMIQTRWHEDDLAGRLLKEMADGGEEWEVVRLPAIAVERDQEEFKQDEEDKPDVGETDQVHSVHPVKTQAVTSTDWREPGEALCPERYPIETLERTKKKLGSYSFAALYQQEPIPSKGVKFKREWFRKIVDAAPKGLRWKRGYDLAVSLKTSADYTASFRCAYDGEGNLYIADGFRSRVEYPEQRRYIVERLQAERDTEHGIESALHGKALIQDLRRERTVRAFAFKEVKVAGDKLTRSLAWLNLAEAGKLFLVRGAWIDDFLDEIARFPHGKHDDQIDAVSVAVSMLAKKEGRTGGALIA